MSKSTKVCAPAEHAFQKFDTGTIFCTQCGEVRRIDPVDTPEPHVCAGSCWHPTFVYYPPIVYPRPYVYPRVEPYMPYPTIYPTFPNTWTVVSGPDTTNTVVVPSNTVTFGLD